MVFTSSVHFEHCGENFSMFEKIKIGRKWEQIEEVL